MFAGHDESDEGGGDVIALHLNFTDSPESEDLVCVGRNACVFVCVFSFVARSGFISENKSVCKFLQYVGDLVPNTLPSM